MFFMKICAVIAEYNPFHLGHLKQIQYIKNTLNADKIIVLLSGNFTERGEPAVLNKFKRAKEAVLGGADLVIELPTIYATANAETFAFGAVKLIENLGVVDCLCFGVESGNKENYISLAKEMNNESKEFKKILKENLDLGYSLCKSKFETVKKLGGNYDESLISSPNNILGLEYTKALLKLKSKIEICPILREGDHNDKKLVKGVTSAKSIREIIKSGKAFSRIKKCVPPFTYKDIGPFPSDFDKMIISKVITESSENLAKLPDCSEGLENRIKALVKDNTTVDGLVNKVSTKRYTESRVRRILICNLLGITKKIIADSLDNPLYAKVLAVKDESKDLISLISKNITLPLVTRKSDADSLKKTALTVFNIDVLANDLYNLATNEKTNEFNMLII